MKTIYEQTYQGLAINTNKEKNQGCYTEILDRLNSQVDIGLSKHSKLIQVRMDLR